MPTFDSSEKSLQENIEISKTNISKPVQPSFEDYQKNHNVLKEYITYKGYYDHRKNRPFDTKYGFFVVRG